jgi:hypothetical protein
MHPLLALQRLPSVARDSRTSRRSACDAFSGVSAADRVNTVDGQEKTATMANPPPGAAKSRIKFRSHAPTEPTDAWRHLVNEMCTGRRVLRRSAISCGPLKTHSRRRYLHIDCLVSCRLSFFFTCNLVLRKSMAGVRRLDKMTYSQLAVPLPDPLHAICHKLQQMIKVLEHNNQNFRLDSTKTPYLSDIDVLVASCPILSNFPKTVNPPTFWNTIRSLSDPLLNNLVSSLRILSN